MAAKPLPRWRLAARAASIWAARGQALDAVLDRVVAALVAARRARSAAGLARPGVVDLFRELGATFIKVGQIMSTRPDLLPEYVSNALAELQDDVGPFPFEDVVRTIEGDLRPPAGDALRRVRAGAAGVGVGVAGAQGAPARRTHRRGQGPPPQRRRALHVRPGGDAPGRARCSTSSRRSRRWRRSPPSRSSGARSSRSSTSASRPPTTAASGTTSADTPTSSSPR